MRQATLALRALVSTAKLLIRRNIKLSASVVDTGKFLKNSKRHPDVYRENTAGIFYDPFNFSHTDFGKLILVSIDGHPEIVTVELVVQRDNKGAFVVIYYRHGKVENYINPYLTIDHKYLKPNPEWEIAGVCDFDYDFSDTEQGLHFKLDITTRGGRRLKVTLQEKHPISIRHTFLAAICADLSAVKRFPFIYLRDAGFVPVEGTEVRFEIDERQMAFTRLPLKVEGIKCYKIVSSLTPLPFFWNEERDSYLSAKTIVGFEQYQKGNATYTLADNDGHKEIEKITYNTGGHSAHYVFSPAFPDISSLKADVEIEGRFCLGVDEIDGIVGGTYAVRKVNDGMTITLQPEECWQPMPGKPWVSSYRYRARLDPAESGRLKIQSEWTVK